MIFCFSGTGNTRWAAERLTDATGERLTLMTDGNTHCTLTPDERIGFCFPVHGWQPPRLVRNFIRRLTFSSEQPLASHYCYALVTCGDSIGLTMEMLNEDLEKKGLHASSTFSLVMPESYVCLPFMYTDTPQREKEKINQANIDLEVYARLITERRENEHHTKRGFMPWVLSHVIGAYFNSRMISDRKFTVDAADCIHCGLCAKVCPTGDIRMTDNGDGASTPEWQHDGRCTCCLSCYHHCPRHAINYGSITRRRGQYYFGHLQ